MVKLPTREALGPLPSARTGTAVVRPDFGGVARGVVAFGRSLEGVGADIDQAAAALDRQRQKQAAFDAEQRMQEFDWNEQLALDKAMRAIEPGQAATFADDWQAGYIERARAFKASLPEPAKPFADERLFRTERGLYGSAIEFQRSEQRRFSVNAIDDTAENVWRPRARTVPTGGLDEVTAAADRMIAANPHLTPIEQDEIRRKVHRAIGLSHLDALDPEDVERVLSTGMGAVDAETLLKRFEGFRSGAYWDVNAHRAGYGSDTVTLADGSVAPVDRDTKVTRLDAERDLKRRVVEFGRTVEGQVGDEAWDELPGNARAALTSVAYNYGSLPKTVVAAVATGDMEAVAAAVEKLPANPERRRQEAAVIRGASLAAPTALAALTDEDRAKALAAADREIKARQVEDEKFDNAAKREITKTGYDMVFDDQMTPEWLSANRDTLNVTDYKAFLRALQPGSDTRKTTPEEYLRLYDLADNDPALAIEEVRDLYANDQIAKADFKQLTGIAQRNLDSDRGKTYESELRSYIYRLMAPGERAPKSHNARRLDALFQWDDWLKANPQANRDEMRKQAQTIIDDFRSINYRSGVTSLPLPRFTNMTPNNLTIEELQRTKARTALNFQAGAISQREAIEQAATIRRWLDILRYRD